MTTFSIVIPVKPGGEVSALEPLRRLDRHGPPFEVLVAEGCRPSRQRNLAVQQAAGEIIYFLDDDSRVTPDSLITCAHILTDPSVAVVGGPSLTPASDTLLQHLFGAALTSPFGAGGVRNRYQAVGAMRDTDEKELILCNLAVRREVFLAAGGFDERLYPNEENELLDRVAAAGQRLVHAPALAVQRSQRRSIRQFVRQMFSYGRGRGQQTLISRSVSPLSLAPLGLVLYLLSLPAGLLVTPWWAGPLALYLGLDLLFTLRAMATGGLSCCWLLLVFPLLHISNGLGLLAGLQGGRGNNDAGPAEQPVVVRRIKTFDQDLW